MEDLNHMKLFLIQPLKNKIVRELDSQEIEDVCLLYIKYQMLFISRLIAKWHEDHSEKSWLAVICNCNYRKLDQMKVRVILKSEGYVGMKMHRESGSRMVVFTTWQNLGFTWLAVELCLNWVLKLSKENILNEMMQR